MQRQFCTCFGFDIEMYLVGEKGHIFGIVAQLALEMALSDSKLCFSFVQACSQPFLDFSTGSSAPPLKTFFYNPQSGIPALLASASPYLEILTHISPTLGFLCNALPNNTCQPSSLIASWISRIVTEATWACRRVEKASALILFSMTTPLTLIGWEQGLL